MLEDLPAVCRRFLSACLLSLAVGAPAAHAAYEQPSLHDARYCAPDGVALGGYDVVSYFEETGPVVGAPEWTTRRGELTYRFASRAHREAFEADPERYLPTYRGWCSATLAVGRLACPDPTNYKLENGSLLLFERIGFSNGLDMWNLDPVGNRRDADGHFARLDEAARSAP